METLKKKLQTMLLSTITEEVGEKGIHAVSRTNRGCATKRTIVFFLLNRLAEKGTTWEDPEADF